MIGSTLVSEIDEYVGRLRQSKLYEMAAQGRVSHRTVQSYLANLRYVFRETPVYLKLARRVALERGEVELANFFEQKLEEEAGHDRWAEDDLRVLDPCSVVEEVGPPFGPLSELFVFLESAIVRDPYWLLPYLLMAEYVTVAIGPEWVALLETRCSVPASAMTSVSRHVEHDEQHVRDDIRVIDDLLPSDFDLAGMQATLRTSINCWERFYEELAALPN